MATASFSPASRMLTMANADIFSRAIIVALYGTARRLNTSTPREQCSTMAAAPSLPGGMAILSRRNHAPRVSASSTMTAESNNWISRPAQNTRLSFSSSPRPSSKEMNRLMADEMDAEMKVNSATAPPTAL